LLKIKRCFSWVNLELAVIQCILGNRLIQRNCVTIFSHQKEWANWFSKYSWAWINLHLESGTWTNPTLCNSCYPWNFTQNRWHSLLFFHPTISTNSWWVHTTIVLRLQNVQNLLRKSFLKSKIRIGFLMKISSSPSITCENIFAFQL